MLNHLAIIMDGNGRWAVSKGLPRVAGHKKGAEAAKEIIKSCPELGIKHLTLYAFSSENWNRPKDEVSDLMNLLSFYLNHEIGNLHKEGVKFQVIGDRTRLSEEICQQIADAERLTENNDVLNLHVAVSYGSRGEIVNAAKNIIKEIKDGTLTIDNIDEDNFSKYLYTKNIPEPDLLIRTGGEQRLSNFLLWQCAYSEFFFTETLWPDFSSVELESAVAEFHSRERRFGDVSAEFLKAESGK